MTEEAKPTRRTINLRQISERLGVCYETARRWAQESRLPVFKLNGRGHWRAFEEDIDAYLETHKNKAAAWSER